MYKMICDLTDEEISKLDLPIPLDTTYFEIGTEINCLDGKETIVAYADIFTEEDSIEKIEHLRKEFGKTIFLLQKEADKSISNSLKIVGGHYNECQQNPYQGSQDIYGIFYPPKINIRR